MCHRVTHIETKRNFILLSANPRITSQKIAHTLGLTDRTIKRALKTLREAGVIKRVGSDKTGHWEIIRIK